MLTKLRSSQYVHHVAMLATGTAIAQAIPIAVSPILTRLYSPEEFGLLAIFMACAAVLSIIATGRYELAIMLPLDDKDAANLVVLTLKISAVISLFMLLIVVFFNVQLATLLGKQAIAPWLYVLPVTVFTLGAFQVFQFWCNRKAQYRRMSTNRMQQSAAIAIASVLLGWWRMGGGQIIANVFGQSISLLWLGRRVWREHHETFAQVTHVEQRRLARRYASHPLHLVPSHLIGAIALQIPVFLMTHVFSLATAGLFSLATRFVAVPTLLVADAIGSVYRQNISDAYNRHGEFRDIFKKTLCITSVLSLVPFTLLYVIAPSLFAFVYGEAWRVAGEYAQILVVASFFQFVFTPIDKGALVVGATQYIFGWHLTRLLALLALFIVACTVKLAIEQVLWLYVGINIMMYLTEGIVGFYLAKPRGSI